MRNGVSLAFPDLGINTPIAVESDLNTHKKRKTKSNKMSQNISCHVSKGGLNYGERLNF
jgi:hypothetical protein